MNALKMPRLLPLTIVAMLGLLFVKSGNLVLAATAEPAAEHPAKAAPAASKPPAPHAPAEPSAAVEKNYPGSAGHCVSWGR